MNSSSIKKIIDLIIDGEELRFDFRRAIFWPKYRILLIADMHIGKAGHFRKNGIAIPNSVALEDFERLETLIENYSPKELIILGDLSHSRINKDWDLWLNFRAKFSELKVKLVPGNHDILPKKIYDEAKIIQTEVLYTLKPFNLIHEPELNSDQELRQISGHVHPGIRLKGAARQGMTLPCFYISESNIILPAFSGFTGRFKIKPKKKDTILALMHKGMMLIDQ